jgi:TldD protein
MNELVDHALDVAQRAGAGYADVRVTERETESVTVKNGALEAASSNLSTGFGVRVLLDGAGGFAGSAVMTPREV